MTLFLLKVKQSNSMTNRILLLLFNSDYIYLWSAYKFCFCLLEFSDKGMSAVKVSLSPCPETY